MAKKSSSGKSNLPNLDALGMDEDDVKEMSDSIKGIMSLIPKVNVDTKCGYEGKNFTCKTEITIGDNQMGTEITSVPRDLAKDLVKSMKPGTMEKASKQFTDIFADME
jgi:hypothetical protein